MKTCSKCGFVGNEREFRNGRNVCKVCISKSKKEWILNNSEHVQSYIKKYRKEHKDRIRTTSREWVEKNIEHVKKKNKEKYAKDPAKVKAAHDQWAKQHPEKIAQYCKEYRERHKETVSVKDREKQRAYRHTINGNINMRKHNHARRGIGHNPLNEFFKDSEEHHLRYSNSAEDKDNDMTIYVPKELHKSIRHNGTTGKNMREINIACLEWYFANTSIENRNKKAVDLYLKYCMMPEPVWISEPNAPKFA